MLQDIKTKWGIREGTGGGGSCENGNESSGSAKDEKFLDRLSEPSSTLVHHVNYTGSA
jgi:hypothetical protein